MKKHKAVKYLISRCHAIRIQLFAINSGRHTKEMTVPFCPPDVEEGKRKTGKLPGVQNNGSRIRNPIHETTIMDIIRNNFPRLDQIREIKTNRQLTKTQLTGTK
jgi:hypothetical protein